MMNYPASYAFLSEEEMEYTTGGEISSETVSKVLDFGIGAITAAVAVKGIYDAVKSGNISSLLATACITGASALSYLNFTNIGGVAAQLQKMYPERYPEDGDTLNGNLIIDSALVYVASPIGALLSVANVAATAGYLYLLFN